MNDAASFDAIMQCNLLEVFCEALGAAIFVTDKFDQVTFASIRLFHFYPIRQTAIEPGNRARDLYGALFDAGCRFGHSDKRGGSTRDEWIAERTAIGWRERVDTIEQAGPDRWVRIVSRRFSSGLGFVVMQDVSEHKKKENLLRAEQERVKLTEEILDTLPIAVAVKDRNLHFVAVNQQFAALTQLPRREHPGSQQLGHLRWRAGRPHGTGRLAIAVERRGPRPIRSFSTATTAAASGSSAKPGASAVRAITLSRRAWRSPPGLKCPAERLKPGRRRGSSRVPRSRPPLSSAMWPNTPAGSRKVLYLLGGHYAGHGLTLGLAAHNVELCFIRDEGEFAAFVPAAAAAGVVIDFVLIDGDFAPSAFNIVANAGLDFRMIPAGSEDATALAEILRSLQAREQANPGRFQKDAILSGRHTPAAPAPAIAAEAEDRLDVLAVEDNPVNRMALEQILESLELRFAIVASGREAIAVATSENPRLVLADLTLPDMDIEELARSLSRANAGLPIVGLMPLDNELNRRKCVAAGLVDCIPKPLSPDALDMIIRQHRLVDSAISPLRARPAA